MTSSTPARAAATTPAGDVPDTCTTSAGTGQAEGEDVHSFPGLSAPTLALRDLMEAQRHLAVAQAQRMGLGVTDMLALRLLAVHGPMGVSQLAQHLDLRPASVTSLVDRLEASHDLERVRDLRDRRRVTVRVRPESMQKSSTVWEPVVRAMDAPGRALSTEHQQVVTNYLTAVMTATTATASGEELRPPTPL